VSSLTLVASASNSPHRCWVVVQDVALAPSRPRDPSGSFLRLAPVRDRPGFFEFARRTPRSTPRLFPFGLLAHVPRRQSLGPSPPGSWCSGIDECARNSGASVMAPRLRHRRRSHSQRSSPRCRGRARSSS
jgi:hypothetical protein